MAPESTTKAISLNAKKIQRAGAIAALGSLFPLPQNSGEPPAVDEERLLDVLGDMSYGGEFFWTPALEDPLPLTILINGALINLHYVDEETDHEQGCRGWCRFSGTSPAPGPGEDDEYYCGLQYRSPQEGKWYWILWTRLVHPARTWDWDERTGTHRISAGL